MKRLSLIFLFILVTVQVRSQDSLYTRIALKFLTSDICFGRGYVKHGLETAEKFIVEEVRRSGASPYFGEEFTQAFTHPVNTFPKRCKVKLNGKKLKPGVDYILEPGSMGFNGKCSLQQKDSTHYTGGNEVPVHVSLKKKLTYSVAPKAADHFGIEIDKARLRSEPRKLSVKVEQVLVPEFRSRNIACSIDGSKASDSIVVFCAHYDHLGGMGSRTFFPGANDNASGVTMLLNLIRHYRSHPPLYRTVFIFFAGEEAGLVGSKYFVEHSQDLQKIKFLLNLDLLGTGDEGIMVVNGTVHEKEFARLKDLNGSLNLIKEIKMRGKAANSDHYWFSEQGVPCFFIYTLGGTKAYHDVFDVEKNLPLTAYKNVFRLLTAFVATL